MKTVNPILLGLGLGLVLITACGDRVKKDDETQAEGDEGAAASPVLSDEGVASESIASSIDDALADAAESPDSTADTALVGALALADAPAGKAAVERFRSCAVDGDKAVVTFKRAISRTRTFDKGGRTGNLVFNDSVDGKRTWALEGQEVGCHSNGKQADIPREDVKGLSMTFAFNLERVRKASFTRKNGKEFSKDSTTKGEGTRTISFTDVTSEGDIVKVTQSVKSSVKRDISTKKINGDAVSLSSEVKTDDAAPMIIVTERKADDDALVSRTLVSGKKIATGKDGERIETVFKNVKYAANDGCYASSGSIASKDRCSPKMPKPRARPS